jgi:hypothetical protein
MEGLSFSSTGEEKETGTGDVGEGLVSDPSALAELDMSERESVGRGEGKGGRTGEGCLFV